LPSGSGTESWNRFEWNLPHAPSALEKPGAFALVVTRGGVAGGGCVVAGGSPQLAIANVATTSTLERSVALTPP
jgi:hypothetical protein